MPCYTPLKAYRGEGGRIVFTSKEGWSDRPIRLRCGQCRGCRVEKVREWSLRCVHEASLHPANSFITLTYDQESVPRDGSLNIRDWQLFCKRFRKNIGKFRYLMAGEYGGDTYRPHYHAVIFGHNFIDDRVAWKKNRYGDYWYTSKLLESTWQKGFCTVGNLTRKSAAYVAKYCMKKTHTPTSKNPEIRRKQQEVFDERYARIDPETGEYYFVRPEFIVMSRNPGLGAKWFEKYGSDVYPSDEVIADGKEFRPPRFYDDLLDRKDPQILESIKEKRRSHIKHSSEYSEERLAVKERVANARDNHFSKETC